MAKVAENLKSFRKHESNLWLSLAVSVVVVQWLSEGVINQMFPGSSPANPHIGVRLLQKQ